MVKQIMVGQPDIGELSIDGKAVEKGARMIQTLIRDEKQPMNYYEGAIMRID